MARKTQPVDGLLADLRGEGEHSEGEFTLDPRQAAEKLRQFQLADPYHYVLLLAEAAFLSGATCLTVRAGRRELTLTYDGPTEELEHLFTRMFTTRLRPDLKVLGLGLNAALRLAPQTLTVECWDGRAGQRLQLAEGPPRTEMLKTSPWMEGPSGATWRVTLRHRVGWQLLKKVLNLAQQAPEATAVHAFCRWAPTRVELNGEPLLPSPMQTAGALLQAHVVSRDPLCRLPWEPGLGPVTVVMDSPADFEAVLVAHPGPSASSQVNLIINGVWAGIRPLENSHLNLSGVVACRQLDRNVSRSDVVDNTALQRLFRKLHELAKDLLTALLEGLQELPEVELQPRLAWLYDLLTEHVRAKDYDGQWARGPRTALIELPVFRLHDGRPVTTRALLDQYRERGNLLTTRRWWPGGDLVTQLIVQVETRVEKVLRRIFPRWTDAEPLLESLQQANLNKSQFLARPPGPLRLEEPLLARTRFGHGELGLHRDSYLPWCLELGREGRLLGPWQGPRTQLPAGVVGLAYHDALTPEPDWNGAAPCPARTQVLEAAQQSLPELYRGLLEARAPLEAIGEHVTNLLDYLARNGRRWPLELPSELMTLRWLPTVQGERVALGELEPPVYFLFEQAEGPRLPRPTLHLTPSQARVLTALMGKRGCKDASALLSTPAEEPAPLPRVLELEPAVTELGLVGGLRGSLRLLATGRGMSVLLTDEDQSICETRLLDLPIPRIEARVGGGKHEQYGWGWLETTLLTRLHRLVLELARRVARKRSVLKGSTDEMEPYLFDLLPWALGHPDLDREKLLELAILPGPGERRFSLSQLERWLVDRGWVRCVSEDCGPLDELTLLAAPDTGWVEAITSGRVVYGHPPASEPEPEPTPDPCPLPEDPGARRLVESLRGLLESLEPPKSCRLLGARLHVGPGVGLAACAGGDVIINRDHPWVRPLLGPPPRVPPPGGEGPPPSRSPPRGEAPDPPLGRLALLLSAAFSAYNRSTGQLQDLEERRFHRSLVERLVPKGGAS